MLKRILIATCLATLSAWAEEPLLPEADSVVFSPHPHFRWERPADAKLDDVHHIQIAGDEAFTMIACEDRLAVVSKGKIIVERQRNDARLAIPGRPASVRRRH